MPLEIRELIIKVNIEKEAAEKSTSLKEELDEWKDEILRECMDAVLSHLNGITER